MANGRFIPQKEGTIQIHSEKAIFDSRYTEFIPDGVKQQIRAIYSHLPKQLSAQVVRVQQQQGTTDCGLYAIAYAVHVANGDDSAKVKFEQRKMQTYFLEV